MPAQFFCKNLSRRLLVRDHPALNGIDYLEVLDGEAPEGTEPQRTLLIRAFKPLLSLTAANVRIEGGVRITPVRVLWAFPVPSIPSSLLTPEEQAYFAALPDPERILAVRTHTSGDFSTYRLSLAQSQTAAEPPTDFDPILSSVDFSFKVECPSDFDCAPVEACPEEPFDSPRIDYLAKDYPSFRRLMLDRLAVIMPDWQERNPADFGVALVETLAYAADQLSYFQDAVATEAYLGTARRRVSLRRHARLLDYPMHDGVNARAWVIFEVEPGGGADGALMTKGTQLLTQVQPARGGLPPPEAEVALAGSPVVFETMHDVVIRSTHNRIRFYTWGDEQCCLPIGASGATLRNPGHELQHLQAGDVLVFEEVIGVDTGIPADADPACRHAVRLLEVTPGSDPLDGTEVLEIRWGAGDALPFPLCISTRVPVAGGTTLVEDISVARGNVALVDHGETVGPEPLLPESPPTSGPFLPRLEKRETTFSVPYLHDDALLRPAADAMRQHPEAALPAVTLADGLDTWLPQQDLLASGRFAAEFTVEVENDGRSFLRFGDGILGKAPAPGIPVNATYRVGSGRAGNVGAEAIAHVVTSLLGITNVRNPIPAHGGVDPESMDRVRVSAPQAFRTQERAVTEDDYAAVAQRHPEVQKAAATLRWTGSWHTVFVTVDRKGGRRIDPDFKRELAGHLDRFRMAGGDVVIDEPRFIPLDIALTVCVAQGHFRSAVMAALFDAFGARTFPDGSRGFFHPDNFTFEQPVYLSQLVARAMTVPGVDWVEVTRFQRWGDLPHGELEEGRITFDRLEIARLDNDPNRAENGRIEFSMLGGL